MVSGSENLLTLGIWAKRPRLSIEAATLHLLFICLHLVDILSSTLIGYSSILPLEIQGSLNHLHISLQVKPLWLPFNFACWYDNCNPLALGNKVLSPVPFASESYHCHCYQ